MAIEDIVGRSELLPLFPEETEEAIRGRWDAWANEGVNPADTEHWVDTREGSFFYIATSPAIREVARVYDLMGTEFVQAGIPVWSWGEYLSDHGLSVDTEREAAAAAEGEVTFEGAVGTEVGVGVRVVAEAPGTGGNEPREFETIEAGTIVANLPNPVNLTAADSAGGLLAASTIFYYVVTAVSDEGETIMSAQATDTTTAGNRQITLNWDDVPLATGYRIYRSLSNGGPYDFLATSGPSAYLDNGAATPNATIRPPLSNTSGLRVTVAVRAVEAGVGWNVPAGAIATLQTQVPNVGAITNPQPTFGGTDPETDEALALKILKAYQGRGPGTQRDYERWALDFGGGIGRATVIPVWNGPGTVLVIVLTADGDPVAATTVEELQLSLDPTAQMGAGTAPIGPTVTVATATGLTIAVVSTIDLEPGYSLDGTGGSTPVRNDVTNALRDYIEHVEPGQEVVRMQVIAAAISVPGVHDVTVLTLNGSTSNILLDNDPAQVGVMPTPTFTAI